MASSPEEPSDAEDVRYPWLAIVAIAIAVITLVVGISAAFLAVLVLDDDESENSSQIFFDPVDLGNGRS